MCTAKVLTLACENKEFLESYLYLWFKKSYHAKKAFDEMKHSKKIKSLEENNCCLKQVNNKFTCK